MALAKAGVKYELQPTLAQVFPPLAQVFQIVKEFLRVSPARAKLCEAGARVFP